LLGHLCHGSPRATPWHGASSASSATRTSKNRRKSKGTTSVAGPTPCSVGADKVEGEGGASTPAGLDCGPGLASGTATASGAVGVVGVAAAEAGALATTLEMSISRFQ